MSLPTPDDHRPASSTIGSRAEVEQLLLDFVNTEIMAHDKPIAADQSFSVVGVDSLALLKILLFVETRFGFWIPDQDLLAGNVGSVAALAEYLGSRVAAA